MEYIYLAIGIVISFIFCTFLFLRKRGIYITDYIGGPLRTRVKRLIGEVREGEWYTINNLIIKTEDEGIFKTTYIDHIVINKRGIFAIEAKSHSGRIYGREDALEWTEVYNRGRDIYRFYNPIMDNKAHLYFVSVALPRELHDIPLTSAVVFSGCNIKGVKADGIYTLRGLRRLLKKGEATLTPEMMKAAYDALMAADGVCVKVCDHEENLRLMRAHLALGACPECGKELTIRAGRYGDFIACPGYPKCTFSRRI